MSGAGLARTGSTGAVNTNPALLAWVPEEELFTNSSTIQFYSFEREKDSPAVEASPTVLPLYSASTWRTGRTGYGWAISTQELKARFSSFDGEFRSSGQSENTSVDIAGAIGHRWEKLALGMRLGLVRSSVQGEAQFDGQSSGIDFIGHTRSSQELWSLDGRVGLAYEVSSELTIALGGSGPVAVLLANEDESQSIYNESTGDTESTQNRSRASIARTGMLGTGLAFKFGDWRFMSDLYWGPGNKAAGDDEAELPQWGGALGAELLAEKLTYYAGLSLAEAQRGEDPSPAAFNLSAGFKRQHRVATTMYGLGWIRDFESGESQIIALYFGTRFAY